VDPDSTDEHVVMEARSVRERPQAGLPALVHPEWAEEFPWLVQGTTTRGDPGGEFDLGLFSDGSPEARVREHWRRLLEATGMPAAAHARQVHGAEVRVHSRQPGGLRLVEPCDGHATQQVGLLLAVTIADCVPISFVDPTARAVGLLHAGWRGTAAGVLERGLGLLSEQLGARELRVHFGPSICGACYEVGPEVFEAVGEPLPARPGLLDLRRVLVRRAVAWGLDPERLTVSAHCTRCTASPLFSHRAGDRGRQAGFVGIRV
jgi:YfiH family protein